jgi:hypothetical protein
MGKRARERARLERKEAKRARREAISDASDNAEPVNESQLMEEFRVLSERYDAKQIPPSVYESERQRIFDALGIEDGA